MDNKKDFYSEKVKNYTSELKSVKSLNQRLSLLRLLFFVLIIVAIVLGISNKWGAITYVVAALFLSIFVALCVVHGKSQRRAIHLQNLIDVSQTYISRIEGDFSNLPDKGEEFIVPGHDYANDLDVFGNVSLFARFNVSRTAWGRASFSKELNGYNKSRTNDEIIKRQKACEELLNKREMLVEYEAVAIEGKASKMPDAVISLSDSGKPFSKVHLAIMFMLPLIWLVPIILMLSGSSFGTASILLVIVINLIFWFVAGSSYGQQLKAVDGISRQVDAISNLYGILEKEDFSDDYLKLLTKGGAKDTRKASEGLKVLANTCSKARLREQPILALILNAIYPYDIYCGRLFNNWALNYGAELKVSIEALATMESLMSCACVGIVSKEYSFPKLKDCALDSYENAYFSGEMITHPLINPEKVVSNSITLDGKTALITGSNMSGKTTLIRTVGICSLLAYMGAPVPAISCELGRMRIISSMRIVDSIEEQMSTFRAELVRIAGIVKAAEDKMPMLYLIDEIFRGTNSKDRTDGAMTVLKKLGEKYIIGMMTTHDYALCDMCEKDLTNIAYYHFSETYENDGITFDYKLRNGVSHESNATYLMRLVGIM